VSIIRSPRLESNFSIMSNAVIRDSRLSYRARGVLLEILSRPDNWRVSGDSLARTGKEGRDAILTALKELRDCGYIKTETKRLENGRFETNNYVYDTPQDVSGSVLPSPEIPTLVQPSPEKPEPEKPGLGNQGSLEELSKKNLDTNSEFEIFWNVYPRKVAKKSAEIAFAKAMKHTPFGLILSGAGAYAHDPNRVDAYTAHPATWLNGHRWLDAPLPEREKTVDEKKAEELRKSKEKEELDRKLAREFFEEQEAARARAVPMPETLRALLRK
jgi:hypothetical protein